MASIFNESIQGVKLLIEATKLLKKELKELATQSRQATKELKFEKSADFKKLENEIKLVSKAQKELIGVEKEEARLKKELQSLQQAEQRTLQAKQRTIVQVRKEEERQVRIAKKLENESKKLTSEYSRQSKRLNELRKRYKDMILSQGGATNATRKLKNEIQALDTRLKKVDADVGQFQRSVGNYKSAIAGSLGTVGQFATGVGAISAGIMVAGRVMGNAIGIIKGFDQASANLAAVLGKTRKDIGALTEDAKRLGAQTAFTAADVTGLQTEFAKLGFTETQILGATEATLSLAAATGTDLANAASVAGGVLGAFGLEASDTQEVVDLMAKSFNAAPLDIENFKEAMKVAGPSARAVGLSVKETTALLGTLAKSSLTGSVAGTGLGTSLIKLNKKGLTLNQGLQQVAESSDKMGTAVELVGINAAKSFLTLAQGIDITADITKQLDNAGGAAERMAKTQLDTLEGKVKILNSAWEGLILSVEDGGGTLNKVSKIIIEDLAIGLQVLSGNVDAAGERLSWFSLLITSIKNQFALLKAALRVLTIPWQILIKLARTLGERFGFISKSAGGLKDILLTLQKVFVRMPQIINIIAEEMVEAALRIADAWAGLGKVVKGVLTFDLDTIKQGFKDVANAVVAQMNDVTSDIPERIKALFKDKEIDGIIDESGKAGDKVGQSFVKAFSNTVKKGVKTVIRTIDDAINEAFEDEKGQKRLEVTLDIGETVNKIANEELDEIIKKQEGKVKEKEKKDAEELARRKKFFQDGLKQLAAFLDAGAAAQRKAHEERLRQIDDEVKASKDQQRELAEDARRGIADAEENLVFARQREREALKQRAAEVEKQKRIEEGLAFTKLLINNASDPNNEQPVLKSISQFSLAKAFIATLSSFFDGTEDTGTTARPLDTKGGRLSVLHDNERVVPKKDNLKMKGITNDELGVLAEKYKQGQLIDINRQHQALHVTNMYQTNAQTIVKMDELIQEVKTLPKNMPIEGETWNDKEKAMTYVLKRNGSVMKRHNSKRGGIWGQ